MFRMKYFSTDEDNAHIEKNPLRTTYLLREIVIKGNKAVPSNNVLNVEENIYITLRMSQMAIRLLKKPLEISKQLINDEMLCDIVETANRLR